MKERHGAAPIVHHLEKRAGAKPRPKKRSELDLLDLRKHNRANDRRLIEALIVIATQANARVLAAIGIVVSFATSKARTAR